MAAERTATTVWDGDLAHGSGTITLGSGVTEELPVTWASRTERSDGKTSPEELLAAANGCCFSMALSHALAEAGTPPERLDVTATCTFDSVDTGFAVTSMVIEVRGRVPNIDAAAFDEAARGAGENCPISTALKGNVPISVNATLE